MNRSPKPPTPLEVSEAEVATLRAAHLNLERRVIALEARLATAASAPPAPQDGEGETAEARARRLNWTLHRTAGDPTTILVAEIRAAESAARADERRRVMHLLGSRNFKDVENVRRAIRALLSSPAGAQEGKGE